MREFLIAEVAKIIPRTRTIIPPAVPIKLIIAFALERSGFTVTSGMSATAGLLNIAIDKRRAKSITINRINSVEFSTVFDEIYA